jgi:hypothetical protein
MLADISHPYDAEADVLHGAEFIVLSSSAQMIFQEIRGDPKGMCARAGARVQIADTNHIRNFGHGVGNFD